MDLMARVNQLFAESIALKTQALPLLAPRLVHAGQMMQSCLQQGHKILSCGNGGSADQAQHFSAEMLNRFEIERPGLPAIALTTDTSALTSIANDSSFDQIFARQIKALGYQDDILLALTTSGHSPSVISAIDAAHSQNMQVVLLTGKDGGKAVRQLNETDLDICVPSQSTARIQEVHLLIIHCLCDIIDNGLFEANAKSYQ